MPAKHSFQAACHFAWLSTETLFIKRTYIHNRPTIRKTYIFALFSKGKYKLKIFVNHFLQFYEILQLLAQLPIQIITRAGIMTEVGSYDLLCPKLLWVVLSKMETIFTHLTLIDTFYSSRTSTFPREDF